MRGFLIVLAFAAALSAQVTEEPVLRGMTDFHHTAWGGLGVVFDIKQSREGYLWLTTSKGVLRFDGARFQTLEEVTRGTVSEGEIDSVFLSGSGGLWLATEGAGLLLWKEGRISNFPDRRCTPSRKQGQIIEDADGSLWVQATAGLFRLRAGVCEEIGAGEGYPGGFPTAILLDRHGSLWVKRQTGTLLVWRRGASKFETTPDGDGVSTGFAFLHQAPDGSVWLSDHQGLRRVTSAPGAPAASATRGQPAKTPPFGDFTFAADGSLWAVTERGVRRFDHPDRWPSPVAQEKAPGESFTPDQGLSSDAVSKILLDRKGVWIGTNSGLDRLRRVSLTAVRLPHTQEHEFSIAAGEAGSIWAGNASLPLTHVAADGTVTSVRGTRQTAALWRDHNGTIWSAGAGDAYLWRSSGCAPLADESVRKFRRVPPAITGGALHAVDRMAVHPGVHTGSDCAPPKQGDRFVPLHYPNEQLDRVLFVATDRNHEPWITTASGRAYHFTNGAWSDQTEALGKKPGVRGAMMDSPEGDVWFAFSNKVVRWDGSAYERSSFPDGQRGVSENTMAVRGDHVWLGGARGVQLFQKGKFSIVRWKDAGVPGRVSGLVETKTGDLWINGFSGITHVAAAEVNRWLQDPQHAVAADHLDELDGLPGLSGEVLPAPSLVEAPDGKLWFATTKGLAWLDPAALEKDRNRAPPAVMISAVISDGDTYAATDGVRLPPSANNVEIDYSALSADVPERVLFRYRLEGVDNDWQDAGTRRQAFYPKLSPANYRFRVIACNNDGVWNEAGAVLAFRILPAFYQTLWFQALCVLAGASSLWFFHLFRLRQTARRLRVRMEERMNERVRVARDLHDTLLQSFQGVLLKFHAATYLLPDRVEEARSTLDNAIEQARDAITEGRNAVQGLRSASLSTTDLAQAIGTLGEQLGQHAEGSPEFRVGVEGAARDMVPLLRDEVYRIACEAVRNAFKHADARQIEVEIRYDQRQFRLRIRDDGKGMDSTALNPAERPGHYGLPGMKERAKLIGGRLTIWSKPGSGTEVELTLPAAVAYTKPRG